MSAEVNASWSPTSGPSAFVGSVLWPLAASAQLGRGQFGTLSPSTGFATLNDGTSPNQIAAGVAHPSVISGTSTVAGAAKDNFWIGYQGGMTASTIASDGFTQADICAPFFIANETTPGKKSNHNGSNRSLGGLVMGLDASGKPILICGPIPWMLARSALVLNAKDFAWINIADAAASTAISERVMASEKFHGLISAVEFAGAAITADNTDYITVTVAKRSLSDAYAAATTIATYDSRAANNGAITAFTPAQFALSAVAGALNVLETDVYTITTVKGGSGKTITGAVRVIGKVQ